MSKNHIRTVRIGNGWWLAFGSHILGFVGTVGHCINPRHSHFPPNPDKGRIIQYLD